MTLEKCQFRQKHGKDDYCTGNIENCEYIGDRKLSVYWSGYNLHYFHCWFSKSETFRKLMREE